MQNLDAPLSRKGEGLAENKLKPRLTKRQRETICALAARPGVLGLYVSESLTGHSRTVRYEYLTAEKTVRTGHVLGVDAHDFTDATDAEKQAALERFRAIAEQACKLFDAARHETQGLMDRKAGYSPVTELRERGFSVVNDGGAVIVIGKRGTIPIDRPVGAMDLMSTTTARRFGSADDAVNALIRSRSK